MGKTEPVSHADNLIEDSIEHLTLENNLLRVTVLPLLGGKIASLQLAPSGEELLQKPLRPYAPRTPFMSFEASDASGWDECLPSVAACEVQTPSGASSVPDHGDFWQVEWQTVSQSAHELTLSAHGFSLPLRFSKTLRLEENRLSVAYTLRNTGNAPLEYVWSAHPLFAVEEGDRIVLPSSVREVVVEGSAGNRLGIAGTKLAWPQTAGTAQELLDLSLVGTPADEIGDKLFAAAPSEGWCAIERRRLKCRIEFQFDPQQVPYLGLWICYGGWPEDQEQRQYCVALEPCTARGDSLAAASRDGRARQLAPAAEDHWSLMLRVSGVS